MIRLLRQAEYKQMPWQNGGGVTTEVARHPAEGAFDWRVSMARVEADGPFSAFPGIERSLAILAGEGLALALDEAPAVHLTAASAPWRFAADLPCQAALLGGPVLDLNVMTRSWRYTHRMTRLTGPGLVQLRAEVTLLLAHGAAWRLDGTLLAAGDAALAERPGGALEACPQGPGGLYVIEIAPTATGAAG